LNVEVVVLLLANLLLAVAAFGCAACLYRFASEKTRAVVPIATLSLIGVTAVITGLQFVFPEVLTALRRNREALLAGEWWRMVTPLFVQAAGRIQVFINGILMIALFPLTERLYGKRLLALYFIPGVLGEIFGYLWRPDFAGSSLGIAGVMGGLFAFAFVRRHEVSKAASGFAIAGVTAAVTLCLIRDTHGPPVLVGVLLASMIRRVCALPSWASRIGRSF
jgi:membrane associated rhomboid family serine protease